MALGARRSRVVMMNEAHDGLRRCIRTRRVGQRVLPAAHGAGVRHLAMEALDPAFAEEANATREVPSAPGGYLGQPEMREFISAALDLGWWLVTYEADHSVRPPRFERRSREATNWREEQQARNLLGALEVLPTDQKLLVWCGNHHLSRRSLDEEWLPMGCRFQQLSGIEPFAIDQIMSVKFGDREPYALQWVKSFAPELEASGGAAGFLTEDAPDGWASREIADAFVLAVDNALT
jgi:hypothetical protein